MPFSKWAVKAPLQNKLQARANAIARGKALIQKGEALLKEEKKKFFSLCDQIAGEGSYLVYESRAPHPKMRLARQTGKRREIDEDELRKLITPEQWLEVTVPPSTERVFSVQQFDAAAARGAIPAAVVEAVTSYVATAPQLIWQATAVRTKYPLEPGQVAIVTEDEEVAQEA